MRAPGPGLLLVRADAGPAVGLGHVTRCLALALAWRRRGGEVRFASAGLPARARARLLAASVRPSECPAPPGSREDAEATVESARRDAAAWVVVDGYDFDERYLSRVASEVRQLLVIDDEALLGHYDASLVLNQNSLAGDLAYRTASRTRLLLGPTYALLRPEFALQRRRRRPGGSASRVRRLLVTLGAAAAAGVLVAVLDAVVPAADDDVEVRVVAGLDTAPELAHALRSRRYRDRVEVLDDVRDMARQMAWADAAVSAAGSTSWELASLGVPAVLVVVAANQRRSARHLERCGAFLYGGEVGSQTQGEPEPWGQDDLAGAFRRLVADAELRASLAATSWAMVDGLGADRVAEAMMAYADAGHDPTGVTD